MGLREAHEAMKGKIAVVVGGAAGYLGRGTTVGLANEGVRIICCDNDREGLAAIVPEVEAMGARISAHYADVMDPDSLDAFWDAVEAETDHIDILVNVAGGVARSMFDQTTRETHRKDIRLNYGYHIDSCQRALPLLRKSGNGGSIVNFTTIEAHRGAATFAVYAGERRIAGEAVHPDLVLRDLHRKRAAEILERRLGARVDRKSRGAAVRLDRREIDDGAAVSALA